MDIDEAKSKKHKAIEILKSKDVTTSLQWLMDKRIDSFIQLDVIEKTGDYDGTEIDASRCFSYNGNNYELYYLDGHSFYTPDGGAYMGEFKLIFNDELVLKTTYSKKYDKEWEGSKLEINFYEFSVEILKLQKWIEEIPELVKREKILIENKIKDGIVNLAYIATL